MTKPKNTTSNKFKEQWLRSTRHNRDVFLSISLHEYINGIPERLVIEKQRRDVLKHDPCTQPNATNQNPNLTRTPKPKKFSKP